VNRLQLREAIEILNKKGYSNGAISEGVGITIGHLSRMLTDKEAGRKAITKKFISSFQRQFGKFLPIELFDDEIIVKTDPGTIIEKQIQHEAWLNVLEGMIVSLVHDKTDRSIVSIISQLKKEKAMEADRISDELRRKKK